MSSREERSVVTAVSQDDGHRFHKRNRDGIRLLAGLGVEGDAHAGETVQHRSRVKRDPTQPNLRQVHLLHSELHDELRGRNFEVAPGELGENITTRGIALLELPTGAKLRIGSQVVVQVTGLRNPCKQLNDFQPGLMDAALDRDAEGRLVRKAGVMAVVLAGGDVKPGDPILVELPELPPERLEPV